MLQSYRYFRVVLVVIKTQGQMVQSFKLIIKKNVFLTNSNKHTPAVYVRMIKTFTFLIYQQVHNIVIAN